MQQAVDIVPIVIQMNGGTHAAVAGPYDNALPLQGSADLLAAGMAACLLCASPRTIGVLCTTHGVAIASPGITSEQIFSRAQPSAASLVDAWGCPHPLADGTKIGRLTLAKVADIRQIDVLITDDGADRDELERIASLGVEVHIVSPRGSVVEVIGGSH